MITTSRDDLPDEPIELAKLARRLGFSDPVGCWSVAKSLPAATRNGLSDFFKRKAGREKRRAESGLWLSSNLPLSAFRSPLLLDFDHPLANFGWHNKDFAVAHTAGASHLDDLADDLFHAGVIDPQADFNLRQKRLRVLAAGVLVEVILLTAVAFYLADADRFERARFKPSSTCSAR